MRSISYAIYPSIYFFFPHNNKARVLFTHFRRTLTNHDRSGSRGAHFNIIAFHVMCMYVCATHMCFPYTRCTLITAPYMVLQFRCAEKSRAPKEADLLEAPNTVPRQDLSIIRLFPAIFLLSHHYPILRAATKCESQLSVHYDLS